MQRACFECGAPSVHDHHVVPRSLGGTKVVPLCYEHHAAVHGFPTWGRFGKQNISPALVERAAEMYEAGWTLKQLEAFWRAAGERCSSASLSRALRGQGITRRRGRPRRPDHLVSARALKARKP